MLQISRELQRIVFGHRNTDLEYHRETCRRLSGIRAGFHGSSADVHFGSEIWHSRRCDERQYVHHKPFLSYGHRTSCQEFGIATK